MVIEQEKRNHVINFLKTLLEIEGAIAPYQEQKRELREEYKEKGYLSKDEMWAITKAYRMHCDGKDVQQFNDIFDMIAKERESGKLP